MNMFVEMFEITEDHDNKGFYHPMSVYDAVQTSYARRSNRLRSDIETFKELHKVWADWFKNEISPNGQDVYPTSVPVRSIDYFQGWFYSKKLYNSCLPHFIAVTKEEASRLFKTLIDWKHLPVTNDHETFISWDMFPETFFDVQDRVNDMLDKFEDGKTFIVIAY